MSIRGVLLVLMLGLLAGCAKTWDKPGATAQDFNIDSYNCEKDARQSGYFGGGLIGLANFQSFIDRCMVAHGWTARKT